MKLLIGNRNYSTWSLRPWLVLRHFDIAFEDEVLLLCGNGWRENLQMRSPTGKVPVLLDGDLVLPETLAIIEYLADLFPAKSIWPADRELPLGWNKVGKSGPKAECLDYIKEVWTDMRPLSLRKKMEEDAANQG